MAQNRRPLSRELVLTTALEVLDDVGLDGLSLRRIAERLGVDPMTLYRYAASKDELLDALTGMLYAEVEVDPTGDPRAALHATAASFRSAVLRHPHVMPLLAVRPLSVPLSRRPREALALVEDTLAMLEAAGLDEASSIRCYQRVVAWLMGWLLTELRVVADVPDEDEPAVRLGFQHLPGRQFGRVRVAARTLEQDTGPDDYHRGLDRLLDDFLPRRPEATSPAP